MLLRWLARAMVGLAVLYIGVIVVFMWIENRLVYHPQTAGEFWERPSDPGVEDVWLKCPDGTRIHGWWCPTPGARRTVLFCHGNAGNVSRWYASARDWQEHVGAAVLVFDYPGYGKSEGKASEAGCYAAAEAAYDWLVKERGVAPDELVLCGVSLGGGVAVELAGRRPHRALVLLCTFTNIPDMAAEMFPLLPLRWFARTRFDNLAKLPNYAGNLFVAHGDADELVPFKHSTRLFAAATTKHKELYTIPSGGHNTSATSEFYSRVKNFLDGCGGER
jgi:fermentation-respiration switch protein FrsA (DUF1100 family)